MNVPVGLLGPRAVQLVEQDKLQEEAALEKLNEDNAPLILVSVGPPGPHAVQLVGLDEKQGEVTLEM